MFNNYIKISFRSGSVTMGQNLPINWKIGENIIVLPFLSKCGLQREDMFSRSHWIFGLRHLNVSRTIYFWSLVFSLFNTASTLIWIKHWSNVSIQKKTSIWISIYTKMPMVFKVIKKQVGVVAKKFKRKGKESTYK